MSYFGNVRWGRVARLAEIENLHKGLGNGADLVHTLLKLLEKYDDEDREGPNTPTIKARHVG